MRIYNHLFTGTFKREPKPVVSTVEYKGGVGSGVRGHHNTIQNNKPSKITRVRLGTVETWYDRNQRSYVTQLKDPHGNQIGDAYHDGDKLGAIHSHRMKVEEGKMNTQHDAQGRFGTGGGTNAREQGEALTHAAIIKHFDSKMKSPVSERFRRIYNKDVNTAFSRYSAKAKFIVMQHVKKIKIVKQSDIDSAMGDKLGDSFGAYYSPWKDMIALSDENIDAVIIAHESAHALDFGDEFSDTKEWKSIYKDEFKKGKALGSYSRTNAVEAFAKAMEYTTCDHDYALLKSNCPRAHAFLIKNDLIKR